MCASPFWEASWFAIEWPTVPYSHPYSISPKVLGGIGGNNSILGCSSILYSKGGRLTSLRGHQSSTLQFSFFEARGCSEFSSSQPAVKLWEQRGVYIPLTVQSACYAHCWDLTRDPELYRSSRKRPLKSALEYIHRCGCASRQGQKAANLAAQENFNSL